MVMKYDVHPRGLPECVAYEHFNCPDPDCVKPKQGIKFQDRPACGPHERRPLAYSGKCRFIMDFPDAPTTKYFQHSDTGVVFNLRPFLPKHASHIHHREWQRLVLLSDATPEEQAWFAERLPPPVAVVTPLPKPVEQKSKKPPSPKSSSSSSQVSISMFDFLNIAIDSQSVTDAMRRLNFAVQSGVAKVEKKK
jgi:hypothetical protein